ncbi:MAG: response regulator transcription factor [Hyphomicrobiales bacterium]
MQPTLPASPLRSNPDGDVRVLVAGRYPALRAGLRALLSAEPGIAVVGETSLSGFDPGALEFDVLVADLGDGRDGGFEEDDPALLAAPAVLLAAWEPGAGLDAATASLPRAYLSREATESEIAAAVRAVAAGLSVFDPEIAASLLRTREPAASAPGADPAVLTEREHEVLELLALGLPNKGIARRLGISEHTAKFHVGAILAKLGAASRTEAVMLAARQGLLPL